MQLTAKKRTQFGKKTKTLRQNRELPAVVFGRDIGSISVSVGALDFTKVYNQVGETNLVDLNVNGDVFKVLIKEVQLHPVTSKALHANFHKVNLKEKINAEIPIEIAGEEENELIKSGEALPLLLISEVTISALPTDLPDSFEINVAGLKEIGEGIKLSELEYDHERISVVGYEEDELVIKLDYAVQEEEPEEELVEEELLDQVEVTEESDEEESGEKGEALTEDIDKDVSGEKK